MSVDHIRYDLLTQQALRAVVRRVLSDVAKTGALPGEHHFYVTFDTRMPGVKLSTRMRAQYPEEMTVVLQHQFWDLAVSETHFEVALSFNGVSEKLFVPFDTIKGFFDPSVQFGLQFETLAEPAADAAAEAQGDAPVAAEEPKAKPRKKPALVEAEAPAAASPPVPAKPTIVKDAPAAAVETKEAAAETKEAEPERPSGGAEVVRLDRFRKK